MSGSRISCFLDNLDEGAHAALKEVGPDTAAEILRIAAKRARGNPSAYVVRSVRNAKKSQTAVASMLATAKIDLDEDAHAALEEVGLVTAAEIVRSLARGACDSRNASAYVVKAVKKGQIAVDAKADKEDSEDKEDKEDAMADKKDSVRVFLGEDKIVEEKDKATMQEDSVEQEDSVMGATHRRNKIPLSWSIPR